MAFEYKMPKAIITYFFGYCKTVSVNFFKSAEISDRFFAVFQNFMSITVFKVLLTARVITLLFSVLWTLHII